jgi:hypothetical protein
LDFLASQLQMRARLGAMRRTEGALIARHVRLTFLSAALVAACTSTTPTPVPASGITKSSPLASPSLTTTTAPTPTAVLTATVPPALNAQCGRSGETAFAGVLEARPPGWVRQEEIAPLPHFPETFGTVYGPEGLKVPPYEGPGRVVLYETMPGSDVYFKSRIKDSAKRNGTPIAVAVCGEATNVWLDEETGALVLGWTDRDKADVLVANTADFTVQELVAAAESVSDCCG